jgi:uncharacterized protein (DUF697 family)
MTFIEVIKELSPQGVSREAQRPFVLTLAGNPEAVAAAKANVLGPGLTPEETAAAEQFLCCVSPPYPPELEMRMRHSDLLVSLPGGPNLTDFRPADTIQVDDVQYLQERIFDHRRDLRVPFARRLPGFRELAAERIIRDVSLVNAEFATISGLAGIPLLAPLVPAAATMDILVLTKNQVMMVLRLAGIYGQDMGVRARAKEILGVLGGALGWKTLARELAVGPVGIPVRAGIAYSGTYSFGKGAQLLFDEGRQPTRQEMLRFYKDAAGLAANAVEQLKQRFKGRKGKIAAQEAMKALPAPAELEIIEDESEEPATILS